MPVVGLVLGALAPVGDGADGEKFPLRQFAYLGGCGGAGGFPLCFPNWAFRCPVAAHSLGNPPAALLVAEPFGAGQVADPERDRALGYTQFGSDLVVGEALFT